LTGRLRLWLLAAALAPVTLCAQPAGAKAQAGAAPPSFALAASRGVQELIGTGDHSPVSWNPATGLWGGHIPANWWQSALAVTTLVRYAERTHSTSTVFHRLLLQTYKRNVYSTRWQFANQYMDDTAWWGLAWLAASQYELSRGDKRDAARFLGTAQWDARYIAAHPKPCGGIEWSVGTPPDTIANAQFITLATGLYLYLNAVGPFHDSGLASSWLSRAQAALSWLENTGLINPQTGAVIDSLNPACQVTGGSLTYTEGEVAAALTQMGSALQDATYYGAAANFLAYTINPASGLTSGGILQEHCEATIGACSQVRFRLDLPAYKGIFVNAMADWTVATGNNTFAGFLRTQANAVLQNAIRGPHNDLAHCATPRTCQFSFHWTGERDPAPLGITLGGQESAIDVLTSVLPLLP
jgi:glycosyl hydrolase family 76